MRVEEKKRREKEKRGGAVGERTAPLRQTPQHPKGTETKRRRSFFFEVSKKLLSKKISF